MRIRTLLFAGLLALVPTATLAAISQFDFDVTYWHKYYNDFDSYVVGNWVLTTTEAGAGDATEALTNLDGGALLITNDAADDDRDFFQNLERGFTFSATQRLYFKARFKVSDATQSDLVFGLQTVDTTPLAVSDGIWFQKDDGDAFLDLHLANASAQTDAVAITTLTSDLWITIAFYYDPGHGTLQYYINNELAGEVAVTNAPTVQGLTVSFGLQNGEAVAKTMSVDYIFVAKSRVAP